MMSLFDKLVSEALQSQNELAPLRSVVEKELLHHDIVREMNTAGLLTGLTFIGGTCLRACYGSNRLSEDLDFTGGADFQRESLVNLASHLVGKLQIKYGLTVEVSEPVRETGNVDTWKVKVVTRPAQRSLPAQRINIDICAVPSYQKKPVLLRNNYGLDMGTNALILQAQSREEIFADKIVALALRPNRLKNRDLWDCGWLKQQNVELPLDLLPLKVADRNFTIEFFLQQLQSRQKQILNNDQLQRDFITEMRRFLPVKAVRETVENPAFWSYLKELVASECDGVIQFLKSGARSPAFKM